MIYGGVNARLWCVNMQPKVWRDEKGYLDLMAYILKEGVLTPDRTDIASCIKVFNQSLYFDLRESFPCSTVRPMSLRYGFEELMMFLRGETDTTVLEKKGINFWKGHTSREFLDSRGLHHLPVGSLGKSYSYQYRGLGDGYVDQIAKVVDSLKNDPYSRRHVVDIWAPNDHAEMPLLSCWAGHQFNVEKNDNGNILHLTCKVRSSDVLLGLVSNYQQFAFYLQAMAQLTGMVAGNLVCELTDVHIYANQIDYVKELLTRGHYCYVPYWEGNEWVDSIEEANKVTLTINKELNTLEDLVSIVWEDIVIDGLKVNKEPFKLEKPKVAI